MRQFAAITVLVVCVALGLSFLLLPSEKELGTMLLRDREYEESRRYFEEQIAAGDTSPQVITGLLEIYIRDGDVDRAIALVDGYEMTVGSEPAILERLALLYRQDRRFGLYLRTLEELASIDPTQARVEQLADAYYKAGKAEKRVAALEWLRTFDTVSPERQVELAELQVQIGRYESAIDTLEGLLKTVPSALDASYRLQLFDLTLHQGDQERAARIADSILALDQTDGSVIALADVAVYRRAPQLALDLLSRRDDLEASSGGWRRILAGALRATGRNDEAFDKLTAWWRSDSLPPESAASLLDLAVQRNDLELALDLFSRYGLDRIETSAVISLIGELHRAGKTEAVDALLAEIGNDSLNEQPVLGAEIMVARNDLEAANRFADRALATGTVNSATSLALASVLAQLDRHDDAFALLHPYISSPDLPVEAALV